MTTCKKNLVSVITPAFNVERYIADTIASVLNQTYSNFEYIIVDDGSTDNTASIIKSMAHNDSRIRLIKQKNLGAASARNIAIHESRGKFIAFVDGDDLWDSYYLRNQLAELKNQSPMCCGVFCWSRKISENGGMLPKTNQPKAGVYGLYEMFSGSCPPRNGSCLVLKREAIREAGDFGPHRAGHDAEMWLRICAKTSFDYFICNPEFLVYHRKRAGSIKANNSLRDERVKNFRYRIETYLPLIDKRKKLVAIANFADSVGKFGYEDFADEVYKMIPFHPAIKKLPFRKSLRYMFIRAFGTRNYQMIRSWIRFF